MRINHGVAGLLVSAFLWTTTAQGETVFEHAEDVADVPACNLLVPADVAAFLKLTFLNWVVVNNAETHSQCEYGFTDKDGYGHYLNVTLSSWPSPEAAAQAFAALKSLFPTANTHDIKDLGQLAYYIPVFDGPKEVMPGAKILVLKGRTSFSIATTSADATSVSLKQQTAVAQMIVAALDKHG